MEEIKYEGAVRISSAEYRELVTAAVEAKLRYDTVRSEKWALESKLKSLETELAEAKKEIDLYKAQQASFLVDTRYTSMAKKSPYISKAVPETDITEEV